MKHLDALMGKKPPSVTKREYEEMAQEEQHRSALQAKLRLLQELSKSPGWAHFVKELKDHEGQLLSLMERAVDPTSLAKLTGSYLAVRSFSTWAQDEADTIIQALAPIESP